MKPIWFLDVDGVINAGRHQQGYRRIDVQATPTWGPGLHNFKIRYNPQVVHAIAAMSAFLDITWLTTWGDQAVTALSPALGLPEFPVARGIELGDHTNPTEKWWKYRRVVEALEDGRRVVWTDDEIPDGALSLFVELDRALVLRPNPNAGLRMSDLALIQAWSTPLKQVDTPELKAQDP